MSRLRLLVAVPGLPPRSMFLVRRQSTQPVLAEQPMHRRAGDGDLMESPQIIRDPAGAEVILLPQIQDLADHFGWRAIGQLCATRGRSLKPACQRLLKRP